MPLYTANHFYIVDFNESPMCIIIVFGRDWNQKAHFIVYLNTKWIMLFQAFEILEQLNMGILITEIKTGKIFEFTCELCLIH